MPASTDRRSPWTRRPRGMRSPLWAILVATAWSMASCAEQSLEAADDRAAVALLADVVAADYASWETMPGFDTPQPSMAAHGQEVQIFVNADLAAGLTDGAPWPIGSLAVKDAYAEGALLQRALIRFDEGGWFFAQFDAADRIVTTGWGARASMCTTCHNRDVGYFRSAPAPDDGAMPADGGGG